MIHLVIASSIITLVGGLLASGCLESFTPTCIDDRFKEFQTLVAGIAGFGGLVWAALYNGQQERSKEERADDKHARNLAHALGFEMIDVGNECARLGFETWEMQQALAGSDGDINKPGTVNIQDKIVEVASPQDTLLEELSPAELSKLGFNAYGFSRLTRLSLRFLRRLTSNVPTGSVKSDAALDWLGEAWPTYFLCSINCKRASDLFFELASKGVVKANELEPPESARNEDVQPALQEYMCMLDSLKDGNS